MFLLPTVLMLSSSGSRFTSLPPWIIPRSFPTLTFFVLLVVTVFLVIQVYSIRQTAPSPVSNVIPFLPSPPELERDYPFPVESL